MILSGYQLMVKAFATQRPTLNNVWNEVFPSNGPELKSLIEIAGLHGTGKSILLYELMARVLLTDSDGDKDCQIIFIDLTHKFDINVFVGFIEKLMKEKAAKCSQRLDENQFLKYCDKLIYLPCYSAEQFEFAFDEFENLLWEHKKISLIAIDGLDNFYWDECNNQLQRMTTHHKKLIQRLKSICQEHYICCAYTVDASYLALKSKPRTYLPQSLIDYKFTLRVKDGRNYLNDSLIKLNYTGIEFVNNK